MNTAFQLAHILTKTKNTEALESIFGTANVEEILESGIDDITRNIETYYEQCYTSEFQYGELVEYNDIIGIYIEDVIYRNESFTKARILCNKTIREVRKSDLTSTNRVLWLDELNVCYRDDGLPITSNANSKPTVTDILETLLK